MSWCLWILRGSTGAIRIGFVPCMAFSLAPSGPLDSWDLDSFWSTPRAFTLAQLLYTGLYSGSPWSYRSVVSERLLGYLVALLSSSLLQFSRFLRNLQISGYLGRFSWSSWYYQHITSLERCWLFPQLHSKTNTLARLVRFVNSHLSRSLCIGRSLASWLSQL